MLARDSQSAQIDRRRGLLFVLVVLVAGVANVVWRLGTPGDWWFEAFVVPTIATEAPEVLGLPPSGSVLVGAIATVGLYTVGWILFGLAALRARAFPRAAALLLLAGGLAGPLALSTPYQIPLAIAIGWIGVTLRPESRIRLADDPRSSSRAEVQT